MDGDFGTTNVYDYGMRYYDARVGRFYSVNPLTHKYPELTPCQFSSNTPIWAIDIDGLEAYKLTRTKEKGFNLSYDWSAKSLKEKKIYFNGSVANISNISKQYKLPYFAPTAYPRNRLGDINYYRWRNDDFNVRAALANKSTPTPEYYLNYGDKYIRRFTFETSKELSLQGESWLIDARKNLQSLMEQGLQINPE